MVTVSIGKNVGVALNIPDTDPLTIDLGADEQLRLMCVHAHPDDESSKGAATMARYIDDGEQVLVVTCTGGQRGDILNPALRGRADIESNLPEVRRLEMAQAVAILGVDHQWLGFEDSGFPEGDPPPPLPAGSFATVPLAEATEALVASVRRFRPHVMTTYDESGGYPHPDHVRCHEVSVAAFEAAGDPNQFPDAGPPWQPLKLYYDITWSPERLAALEAAMVAAGQDSPYADMRRRWAEQPLRRQPRTTTRIYCPDQFERRDAALLAHATQVDPLGMFFKVPLDLQRQVFPWEVFELARSRVPTQLPETDLFAGIRQHRGR